MEKEVKAINVGEEIMKRGKVKRGIVVVGIVIAISCAISVWLSYHCLTVSNFSVYNAQIKEPFRIVCISDLHEHEFGVSNTKLVSEIQEQSPDLIILVGDMLNEDSPDSHVATELITQLRKVAPVYYSLGNHEYAYMEAKTSNLLAELEVAGAELLDYQIYDIEISGNKIRLGGLYEYGFSTPMQSEEENASAVSYLEAFTDTDCYTIICPHRPESLYCWQWLERWGIDLQLSGHLHGGQVILPFVGGVYSTLEEWFPTYDYGQFRFGNSTMIITRGLSSNLKALPRFNNPPEIVVVDVMPE